MVQRYTRSVTFEEDSLKFYRAPLRVSQNLTDAPVTIWGERNKREGRTSLPTLMAFLSYGELRDTSLVVEPSQPV